MHSRDRRKASVGLGVLGFGSGKTPVAEPKKTSSSSNTPFSNRVPIGRGMARAGHFQSSTSTGR